MSSSKAAPRWRPVVPPLMHRKRLSELRNEGEPVTTRHLVQASLRARAVAERVEERELDAGGGVRAVPASGDSRPPQEVDDQDDEQDNHQDTDDSIPRTGNSQWQHLYLLRSMVFAPSTRRASELLMLGTPTPIRREAAHPSPGPRRARLSCDPGN